jgi:hypothetical protein
MPAFAKKERQAETTHSSMSSAMPAPSAPPAALDTPTRPAAAPAAAAPADDLLDILGGSPMGGMGDMGGAAPAAAAPPAGMGMDSMLMDLLGSGPPAPAPAPAPAPNGMDAMSAMMGGPAMGMGGAPAPPGGMAPFTAFSNNGLLVMFSASKDPANASVTLIEATFTNAQAAAMDGCARRVHVIKEGSRDCYGSLAM